MPDVHPPQPWPTGSATAQPGVHSRERPVWSATCRSAAMVNLGKALAAGIGAKLLTGGLIGFLIVFAIIYWIL